MALPPVDGWLIDFRTARVIFQSGSNERIDHCVGLCAQGKLRLVDCEEKLFRDEALLRAPFIDHQDCVLVPDDDVYEKCNIVTQHPFRQELLVGNEAAIYLTAAALAKNLGVISNTNSTAFKTVRDLCGAYGVPVFSVTEYFGAL